MAAGVVLAATPSSPADDAPADVKVMSFNVRYGTAKDGANHWDARKAFLAETVRAFGPDLLGTQETLAFQRDYLAEYLPRVTRRSGPAGTTATTRVRWPPCSGGRSGSRSSTAATSG
jgi:endonuclease/exonuclease/phosphatase family metal-dependent hydrolase